MSYSEKVSWNLILVKEDYCAIYSLKNMYVNNSYIENKYPINKKYVTNLRLNTN